MIQRPSVITQNATDALEQPETARMTNVSSATPTATTDAEKHVTDTDATVTSSVVNTGGYYVDPEYSDDAPQLPDAPKDQTAAA